MQSFINVELKGMIDVKCEGAELFLWLVCLIQTNNGVSLT